MNTKAAALELFEMRSTRRVASQLPPESAPGEQSEAYAVQDELVRMLLEFHQSHAIGYKIAATNDLAQKQLNVNAPFCGRLLSHSTHRSPAMLKAEDFTQRIIEPEFGFLIGTDVPTSSVPYTRESIAPFISAVVPAIEVVDHRFADWSSVGAPSLIADNAIHGAWIEGSPSRECQHVDLASHGTRLIVNGETVRTGSGAAVLGHPLNVVAWLANVRPLRAGDRITTGTTTAVYFANPGDRIIADFGSFGTAEVSFQ